jgi:hypothetical protein
MQKVQFANPPKLASFLVGIGEFDQRRQNLFNNPRALVLVVCENLHNNQLAQG